MLLIIGVIVGGGLYINSVKDEDQTAIEYIKSRFSKDSDEDKDKEEDKDKDKDSDKDEDSNKDKEKEDKDSDADEGRKEEKDDKSAAFVKEADELIASASSNMDTDVNAARDDADAAVDKLITALKNGADKTDISEKLAKAFSLCTKANIELAKNIERVTLDSAGYTQILSYKDDLMKQAGVIADAGLEADTAEWDEYEQGLSQRARDLYISKINEIATRPDWSRDEAWNLADDAYKIKDSNGKPLLWNEDDLDDPLRLRYEYSLAWIVQKRCLNGVADGTMSETDAITTINSVLAETDYNLVLLRLIIIYGTNQKMDMKPYENAYNAIVTKVRDTEGFSITNGTNLSSTTSADYTHFLFFNDLSGNEEYRVDTHNGTTAEVRAWIRENIPGYFR